MESAISLNELSKTYIINERSAGLRAAMRGLFRRKKKEVEAVKKISLEIEPGEIVGFLGPNGAGKTTTLKMLAGLLHPTGGKGLVLGYEPHKRERDFLKGTSLTNAKGIS
jgi:ABC-2 type transport system ATP-binding protein